MAPLSPRSMQLLHMCVGGWVGTGIGGRKCGLRPQSNRALRNTLRESSDSPDKVGEYPCCEVPSVVPAVASVAGYRLDQSLP